MMNQSMGFRLEHAFICLHCKRIIKDTPPGDIFEAVLFGVANGHICPNCRKLSRNNKIKFYYKNCPCSHCERIRKEKI